MTCGRAAFNSLGKTDIADVVAGQEIGFRTMSGKEVNSGGSYGYFYHPGPAQVWLSRAPSDDLKSYHGDGDWFKIAYAGPKSNTEWELYGEWSTPERGHYGSKSL
ncbi:lytic polysaccharide monooxygenase [Lophiostoma macrostomum CBS 122681]|uniref:AA9 family lytic polysaccharide monooxygenase n=1 Tax=Lophiostoma macrostomum CBS 122681 TaxID=1314788 RepID=A0A6A6SP10_9PLEO|nr:lytic polysaccharide monooxygenase [Lophiostoma macrostomum CBS 122681]